MAQKTVVSLIDDLDGTEANETVEYGLDGVTYEIDLNDDNATKLRDALAPYVAAARRTSGKRSTVKDAVKKAVGGTPKRSREENQRIREWAKKQGLEVSERGRIPNEVAEAYDARQLSKSPG
ncbi:histone-like nucleoid-structuring protein Lsr2 [Actinomycetospora straminea]|uniref:Lsr2 family protein n=1 Tax=Actinomycetospora straminea TaxID=663607 RepID=A0ABP9F832_9PSEU|nr:Lsr2 family protein [Actinomycetospora straminea]MDD7936737.1 Lsr2 family protein [Actinomycetospora straminea]